MVIYKRLLKLAEGQRSKFLLALICMAFVGAATAYAAYLIKPALDDVFLNPQEGSLYWISFAVIIVFFVKGIANYGQTVLMNHIGNRIVADLRADLYGSIQKQTLSFFTRNPTGTLISRVTNDVQLIHGAVSEAVTSIFKDTFTFAGLAFVMFYQDWKLSLIAAVILPLAAYPVIFLGQWIRKVTTKTQVTMGNLTSFLQETIAGSRIVKAFGMESHENKRFRKENEQLFRLQMRIVTIKSMTSPLMEFLGGVGIAFIIFYGGYQVIHGISTPGTFFSFLAALLMLYEPWKRLANINNVVQQGVAAATRIFEIIDHIPEIKDRNHALPLPPIQRGISFQNVSFSYGDETILKHINLDIRAGEVIAFVGMSGGGKTTLVNLIPRFYDVTEGTISIDNMDVRDVTLKSLIGQIGIVTQQTFLFNDTVRNNIAYGAIQTSDKRIVEVSRAAHAHDFIINLPEGYDTVIGELGAKLSGGERQRISIARALLKDAPILILDEATSSLDTDSEREVQGALENLMKNRTTLIIAHRLSTIRNADRIIVLSNGEIVEEGTHDDLIVLNGEYSRLYHMQFRNGEHDQHQA